MKQEFFPIVWTSDVTHQLRRYQIPTVCPSIAQMHNNIFWNSCKTGTSSCCFLHKCIETNLSPRIFALRPKTLYAVLDTFISNEQRRLFPFRLDHNDVPMS